MTDAARPSPAPAAPPPSLPDRPARRLAVRLYCRVIDNFGDAGVAWRLARQLAGERGRPVTLVIDAPQALARLLGRDDGHRLLAALAGPAAAATADGVRVEPWPGRPIALPADTGLVIAAFGCELPAPVRAALAPSPAAPPCWVDLEYLSAEDWVDDTHGLPSIKPADGAIEWFVMPGFGPRTGGLLRERGLFEHRDRFADKGGAAAFLARCGVPPAGNALRVSLFCYPHAPVAALLDEAAADTGPMQLLVPEGIATDALQRFLGRPPATGEVCERGALQVVGLPWLPQPDYDRLLWSCDLNFVRGEDSWVRAVWSARPFVWQPYRQDGGAHRPKLEAFLDRLLAGAPAAESRQLRALHRRWVDGTADGAAPAPLGGTGLAALARSAALGQHLRAFAARTASTPDLATTLLDLAARVAD